MHEGETVIEIREPTFFVLASLTGGPKHGYALIRDVVELSGGRVQLKVATLYTALDRLAEQSLIVIEREEVVDARHRRTYALTDEGIAVLIAETARLERNAAQVRTRLAAHPRTLRTVTT